MMNTQSPITRIELLIILILTGVGFVLRIWNISEVGLDHYDEGVYVFSALGLIDSDQSTMFFPDQYLFSPPGYFSLVGLVNSLFGGSTDTAAFLVSVWFGSLSILAVWMVAKSWFGPTAGIISATLLAFNEYHIQLSRTALTDVSFAFFLIVALGMIGLMVRTRQLKHAILAGIMVGIAWNFKYHGWFAVFIATLAVVPFLWFNRENINSIKKLFALWIVLSVVAILCFLPWALYVQTQPGGYPGLLSYQSTLIERHNYLSKLWAQIQQQKIYEGPLSQASIPLAFLLSALISKRRSNKTNLTIVGLVAASLLAIPFGASGVAALLSFLAIYWLFKEPSYYPAWLIFGWLGVWTVMTPLYFPYARLVLPFTIASFIGSGYFISRTISEFPAHSAGLNRTMVLAGGLLTAAVLLIAILFPPLSNPWRPSRSMAQAASEMLDYIPEGERVVVIGEPSLAYYLHVSGRPAFGRLDDPEAWQKLTDPVYFVTGVYTKRAPVLRSGVENLQDRLTFLGEFQVYPKDLRLLDDFKPDILRQFVANPDDTFNLSLYYLNGAASQ
jgi:4-amino-4-deoxy-L-arabinose transferase-like glycosyltransferase